MATRRGALPGFGLTLGATALWLGLVVLVPLAALAARAVSLEPSATLALLLAPRTRAAFGLSFGASLLAGAIAVPLGLLLAWVLVRVPFRGRGAVDALVDLPFALPTAVAGLALTALWSTNGWLGEPAAALGTTVAYTRVGVVVALLFLALPFVVRTVQPVLADLPPEVEEAAAVLGATRLQAFRRVLLPHLRRALATGFVLAVSRALGEYGSIVFVSGNMPMRTEIVPLLIVTKLEQFDDAGATALAVAMLLASLLLILAVNGLQARPEPPR